jgi:HEAT repeat protein
LPEPPLNEESHGGEPDFVALAMSILGSLHAAMVNFHLFPATSDIVEDSVKRALEDLQEALLRWGSVTFCETEGKMLINEHILDDREQSRPNTQAFLKDLGAWGVRSLSFVQGLGDREMRKFLEIFSSRRSDRAVGVSLEDLLREEGIDHVMVDELVYVPLGKDEEVVAAGGEAQPVQAMEMLKDEIFVRYLIGSAPSMEASPQEVAELLSDPRRVNAAFESVVSGYRDSGGAGGPLPAGPPRAGAIRESVDRLYGLAETVADPQLKESVGGEVVNVLSALEPETLAEVLTEQAPRVVKATRMRRLVISSVEGEDLLGLTDRIIAKYLELLSNREAMDPGAFEEMSGTLNQVIAEIYEATDPAYHPEITRRIRESGLLSELAKSNLKASQEMGIYATISEIRSSGSLRCLEGLSDYEVIMVMGKLLDLGEEEKAQKILDVSLRNLRSDRPDFRIRACRFLKEVYQEIGRRGKTAGVLDRSGELVSILEGEKHAGAKAALVELLGFIASDIFVQGRLEDFDRLTAILISLMETESDEGIRRAARAALFSLNPWDVGKPLVDSLFGEDDRLRDLAVKVLPHMEESLTVNEIMIRLKDEEDIRITPQLAQICLLMGNPLLTAVEELMDSNVREEVLIRALLLLELMDGPAALSMVKAATTNPVPMVRAQAYRSLARVSPGDPSLLHHFMQALGDDDVDVRREGVRGLGFIDDPRSVESLLTIANGRSPSGGEEHPRVQEMACLSLARLGPEKALHPLCELLRHKPFALRRRAVHPRVMAAACYALGKIGGAESLELIRSHLDDPDPVVRNEARKAISEMRRRGLAE